MNIQKYLYTTLSICMLFIISAIVIHAQQAESTTSASQSIKESVKEKVEQKLSQIANQTIGVFGQISDIQAETLTLNSDGEQVVITTNDQTEYKKVPGNRALEHKDLSLQDFVIIKGTKQENLFTADTIQVVPAPSLPKRDISVGTIKTITASKITLTIGDKTQEISIDSSTQYYIKNEKGKTAIKSKPTKDDKVFIAHQTSKGKTTPTALMVFTLPEDESKEATPSAKTQ